MKPSGPARCPCWKTQTATPNVALSDAALSTRALAGMTRLPVIRKRARKVTSAITASASGRCAETESTVSTCCAVSPVTRTGNGPRMVRIRCTRATARGELGSELGSTLSQVPQVIANCAELCTGAAMRWPCA